MTEGQTGYDKKEKRVPFYIKKRYLIAGIVIMVFVASALGLINLFGLFKGASQSAAQTATSGGGSPAGPAGIFAPDVHKMNFTQLVNAGKLDTPEKIRQFMIDYPFRYGGSEHVTYEPNELLQAGGVGYYSDFANFFGEALKSQGCWDKWDPQLVGFQITKNGRASGPMRFMIAFHDIRDGNNYYFVPDPDLKFPIYPMGKETDPVTFEEKRLGGEREFGTGGTSYLCT